MREQVEKQPLLAIAIVWQRAKTCRNKQPQFPWKKKKYQWTTLTILSQTMWMLHYYCHAKSWLLGKDSDAGRDWRQEEKGTTNDEMVGWHHWLDGHESEWTPGDGDVQGGLACCDSWGRRVGHDWVTDLIWSSTHLKERKKKCNYYEVKWFISHQTNCDKYHLWRKADPMFPSSHWRQMARKRILFFVLIHG